MGAAWERHATCESALNHCRRETAVLCCRLEKNGTVGAWHGHGMASVNQTWPNCVNQMGKTHSKPLAARHGRGTGCYVWIGLDREGSWMLNGVFVEMWFALKCGKTSPKTNHSLYHPLKNQILKSSATDSLSVVAASPVGESWHLQYSRCLPAACTRPSGQTS